MTLQIHIFDSDSDLVNSLTAVFSSSKSVSIQVVDTMLYLRPPKGLDILFLPLAAAEQFGAKPLVHESSILTTSAADQQAGLPPFIVCGPCLAPGDSRGAIPEMRLLLSAVFDAIRNFNQRETRKLAHIGFWAYNLLVGLTPGELKRILFEVAPELR